jgi:hypothetical protein
MYCGIHNTGVYKSTDRGENWFYSGNGLGNPDVRAFAMDTINNVLYAGTYGGGVYISGDGGQSWEEMNQGWQNASIVDLAVAPSFNYTTIFASHYWAGVWRYSYVPLAIQPEEPAKVERFHVFPNYPNPFNPATNISYQLPRASLVVMTIYDALERRLFTPLHQIKPAGQHTVRVALSGFPAGLYFYRFRAEAPVAGKCNQAGNKVIFEKNGKFILLK